MREEGRKKLVNFILGYIGGFIISYVLIQTIILLLDKRKRRKEFNRKLASMHKSCTTCKFKKFDKGNTYCTFCIHNKDNSDKGYYDFWRWEG